MSCCRLLYSATAFSAADAFAGRYALADLRQAMEIMLLGERFDARRALELGLVNRVVPELDPDLRATAGNVFALFVITIAAAEVGVGLAIVLLIYRNLRSPDLDRVDQLKG